MKLYLLSPPTSPPSDLFSSQRSLTPQNTTQSACPSKATSAWVVFVASFKDGAASWSPSQPPQFALLGGARSHLAVLVLSPCFILVSGSGGLCFCRELQVPSQNTLCLVSFLKRRHFCRVISYSRVSFSFVPPKTCI